MDANPSPAAEDYSAIRVAISSGLFGSIGATLGWILWLAYMTASVDLLVTIVVGACIGLLVSWVQQYVSIAKNEQEPKPDGVTPSAPEAPKKSESGKTTLLWATGFAFLGVASEQVVSELVSEYLRPFLASLVTLLPAGVIFGMILHEGRGQDSRWTSLGGGVFTGAVVALVTCLLRYFMGGPIPWGAMFGWWILIGAGIGLCMPTKSEYKAFHPVLGIVCAFVFANIFSTPVIVENLAKLPGPFRAGAGLFAAAVDETLAAPDLPAQFWIEAEARRDQSRVSSAPVTNEFVNSKASNYLSRFNPNPTQAKSKAESKADRFRSEFGKGMESALVRSWIVLGLFGLGMGFAPGIEKRLRPANYPTSQTALNDKRILIGIVIVVLMSCLYLRLKIPG